MSLIEFLYLLVFVALRDFYLVLLAVALRWTFIEYKHLEFLRGFLSGIFAKNDYANYVWNELLACPFCSGIWAGYVVFVLFKVEWKGISWQLLEFWLFGLACGFISLIIELKMQQLLAGYTHKR